MSPMTATRGSVYSTSDALARQAVLQGRLRDVRLRSQACSEQGFSCKMLLETGLQHLQQDLADAVGGQWRLLNYDREVSDQKQPRPVTDLRAEVDALFDNYGQRAADETLSRLNSMWGEGGFAKLNNNLGTEDWLLRMQTLNYEGVSIMAGALSTEVCQQVLDLVKSFISQLAKEHLAFLPTLQQKLLLFLDSYHQEKLEAVQHELSLIIEENTNMKPDARAPWLLAQLRNSIINGKEGHLRQHLPGLDACLRTGAAGNDAHDRPLMTGVEERFSVSNNEASITAKVLAYLTTCGNAERVIRRLRHVMFAKTCYQGQQVLLLSRTHCPLKLASLNLKDALMANLYMDGHSSGLPHKGALTEADLNAALEDMKQILLAEERALTQELVGVRQQAALECAEANKALLAALVPAPGSVRSPAAAALPTPARPAPMQPNRAHDAPGDSRPAATRAQGSDAGQNQDMKLVSEVIGMGYSQQDVLKAVEPLMRAGQPLSLNLILERLINVSDAPAANASRGPSPDVRRPTPPPSRSHTPPPATYAERAPSPYAERAPSPYGERAPSPYTAAPRTSSDSAPGSGTGSQYPSIHGQREQPSQWSQGAPGSEDSRGRRTPEPAPAREQGGTKPFSRLFNRDK